MKINFIRPEPRKVNFKLSREQIMYACEKYIKDEYKKRGYPNKLRSKESENIYISHTLGREPYVEIRFTIHE